MAQELNVNSGRSENAVFAMHCLWVGEGELANVQGVISSKPGFVEGHEVVELEFNPEIVSYGELVKKAKSQNVARHVFTENSEQSSIAKEIVGNRPVSPKSSFSPDGRPKYYMSGTSYKYVPMTNTQIDRVNAATGGLQSPDFSCRQDNWNYINI